MTDYSDITQDDFNEILAILLNQVPAADLLHIPGIFEILSEEYNNVVLEYWEQRQGGEHV